MLSREEQEEIAFEQSKARSGHYIDVFKTLRRNIECKQKILAQEQNICELAYGTSDTLNNSDDDSDEDDEATDQQLTMAERLKKQLDKAKQLHALLLHNIQFPEKIVFPLDMSDEQKNALAADTTSAASSPRSHQGAQQVFEAARTELDSLDVRVLQQCSAVMKSGDASDNKAALEAVVKERFLRVNAMLQHVTSALMPGQTRPIVFSSYSPKMFNFSRLARLRGPDVDIRTFKKLILNSCYYQALGDKAKNHQDYVLVDVRRDDEIKECGTAPTAVHVPLHTLQETLLEAKDFCEYIRSDAPTDDLREALINDEPHLAELGAGEKNLVFFCRAGNRTLIAMEVAESCGFKRHCHVPGGWLEYMQHPLEKGEIERFVAEKKARDLQSTKELMDRHAAKE